jgi:hypothetical protein
MDDLEFVLSELPLSSFSKDLANPAIISSFLPSEPRRPRHFASSSCGGVVASHRQWHG